MNKSIAIIDPGGVAARLGADGNGIVLAILATGIEHSHPHFRKYGNLDLAAPLQHRDFTLLPTGRRAEEAPAREIDEALLADEALIDVHGLGTHIAGVIAGYSDVTDKTIDWDIDQSQAGIAPRCKLVSLKVLDDLGGGDERSIIAALKYVYSLNEAAAKTLIHGVIVPLSVYADLLNFACGRTPVCEAADKLVESGVIVVAAAGDNGEKGLSTITDPGNAERAITVGATHKLYPHDYGASYFSSRGPTSDGRAKPDLLAPGMRINSSAPPLKRSNAREQKGGRKRASKTRPIANYRIWDGTSMASAHVGGVVAALLSVRPELIGRADEVKELLLGSATDLGRERYLQGRGLINLSRALDPQAQTKTKIPVKEVRTEIVEQHEPATIVPAAVEPTAVTNQGAVKGKRFAVALSFANEHDAYVSKVADALREVGRLPRESIFYDKRFEAELNRTDLDLYLQDLYQNQSELLVVFLSKEYEQKQWTGLEWRVMRELIKQKQANALMLIRFDETQIPGLFSHDGYTSAINREPTYIANLILDRLELNRRRGIV